MSAPVVVTAVFHPREGATQQLVEAMAAGIALTHAESGCLLYAIHDAADGTITMLEKWASAADLEAHATGAAIARLNADIAEHLAAPVVVTVMTPIPAGDAERGLLHGAGE
ncbi:MULTISPECIES: putative quinol monooxygenase [Microbacterium]|jgi:quinol monooxygenase YgiN|uniref:putative quinol monooxygenase n=1 Tax=Microbacterium TaxID=33882 RepID=UPI0006F29194|nr:MULTISPECIES: putative quinol monooxygenase [unclassified Microbacterium]MBN9197854.1 antibiotic biosynthesis monooxygenase [Microbacterium ginsengisoli]MCK9916495.1 antibiotic biosynthesis monooxygenase [Microbacteriaceae bacterium K1510]KQR91665.1 antibiotic biosynthesis monooxygenase [Microbacterium sp. Leaf347]KQR91706.1 antibiotic biosynthesis monooxygenase [Microbacterium sp. Leaf351]OJU79249.1 MAG: antibiotic biosynthesis monooxygenase [Microbacterium sp. 71-23]